jgi:hypothetical protein
MLGLVNVSRREETGAARTAGSPRPWFRDSMHLVRRIHLFSGLFMFPWVMLYGITALLFNHPGAFPDQPVKIFQRADFVDTALESAADPAADAEQVIAALNAKLAPSESAPPRYRLLNPEKARYTRDRISARVRGDGQEHTVLYDVPNGTAFVTTQTQDDSERAPFAMRGLKASGSLSERIKAGLPKALSRKGLAADEAGIAVGTELAFFVADEQRQWKATYNVQTGAVTGAPAHAPSDLTLRKFLTQLHLTHTFPSQGGVQWLWAIGVDAMFVSMVFWACSGLLMWWQLKAVRRLGAIFAAAGIIVAALLALAMYPVLAG